MDANSDMSCPRCRRLMVARPCCARDGFRPSSRWSPPPLLWACVNCGNYWDPTIARHQQEQAATRAAQAEADRHAKLWEEILRQWKAVAA